LVSKTGWTRAAGGCLAIMTEKKKIAIVLNSRSVKTRIPEIQYLVKSYN
jgi:D-alanyl-D-alanine carboxypeptidase